MKAVRLMKMYDYVRSIRFCRGAKLSSGHLAVLYTGSFRCVIMSIESLLK